MIQHFVTNLAIQKGIRLSHVSLFDGRRLGCRDMHLLNIKADRQRTSLLVHQTDIDELERGNCCGRLEVTIHNALSQLLVYQDHKSLKTPRIGAPLS